MTEAAEQARSDAPSTASRASRARSPMPPSPRNATRLPPVRELEAENARLGQEQPTVADNRSGALEARIAELEVAHNADTARIRELEDKLALARIATGKIPEDAAELAANRRMAEAVRKAEAAARKAAQPKPTVPEDETMESLAEKLRQAQQQLKAARTRIRHLNSENAAWATRTTLVVDDAALRIINAALSPSNFPAGSKAYKRAEEAAQLFGSLNIKARGKPEQELKK